ncbi:hypothetical protein C8Q78DRAFT_965163, partial [Trametes maxima]
MDRIPYDVWDVIFRFACTDGGATGCALASTSKFFRGASTATRLYSVDLHSLVQVRNFLICLARIRRAVGDEEPPPVRHLFISFLPGTCDAPLRNWRNWTDYPRTERALIQQLANDRRQWDTKKAAWNAEFVLNVSQLFRVLGPTLRTLTIIQAPEVQLPLVYFSFPLLEELTLLGDDRLFVRLGNLGVHLAGQNDHSDFHFYGLPSPDEERPDDAPVPFPSLRRLHVIATARKLHPWEQTLPRWAALAPAVTHLRVSQVHAPVVHAICTIL